MTKKQKIYRKILIAALMGNLLLIGLFAYRGILCHIPDNLKIVMNEEEKMDLSFLLKGLYGDVVTGEIQSAQVGALSINNQRLSRDAIRIDFQDPFVLQASQEGNYKINVKLFGLIKLKEVSLDVIQEQKLIPGGFPIGIRVKADGIMVLGTGVVTAADGLNYEPSLNILKTGDYILEVNGAPVEEKEQLMEQIKAGRGERIELKLRRNGEMIMVGVTPVEAADGQYKIGAWIREDTQGIGTLTYIGEDGNFGALGHGITDIDTGVLMDIRDGDIYKAEILNVIKGQAGTPGEIIGVIDKEEDCRYGQVEKNTGQGVFGSFQSEMPKEAQAQALPMGLKQNVKLDKAEILCQLGSKIETYEIEIEEIQWNTGNESKGMVIHITDERLLSQTNGIIQGMSGSPILQDGKIIGAVTHVFVRDSTRGYGIFIENMLKAAE